MRAEAVPSRSTYAGLFLVTLATVMYEIILTRIFSVTMWYHFAFVAISLAMFGMTVGALVVYLRPAVFTPDRVGLHLSMSALLFGVSIVLSFLLHLRQAFRVDLSLAGLLSTVFAYTVLATPFVFSGVSVCLALTKFPQHIAKLYAVDLTGAAIACLLVIATLDQTDGPTAVIMASAIATLGAACFAARQEPRFWRVAMVATLILGSFALVHTVLVRLQTPLLRLEWVKGVRESRPLYEKWNSFSRVTVHGDPNGLSRPRGWGLSPLAPDMPVRQLMLLIDAGAGTLLTAFNGRMENLQYLRYDVTNLPHYLRRNAAVLVIGPGGGRDLVSALLFEQRSVVGVEINQVIIDVVTGAFGEFTGHLDKDPRVTLVNDEARSYIARQRERFDIIQVPLIDTWAATAAGAFALTENSLYTVEAWEVFLDHLTPNGLLAVSRFYFRDRPDEIYRLTALANAALRRRGVADPRRHIVIVRQLDRERRPDGERVAPVGMATVLVNPAPFSDGELDLIHGVAGRLQFDLVLSPRYALDHTFVTLASGQDLTRFLAGFPVNIAPPTDDSPFFFHSLRLRQAFDPAIWAGRADHINMKAVSVLGALLVTVVGLTVLCVIVPLALTTDRSILRGGTPFFAFFAAIGFGFMLVEISQMQRLMIFLGHPTYSLSVVLFALLTSSGLGSYLAGKLSPRGALGEALPLGLLLGVLLLFGLLTPPWIRAWRDSTTAVRILVSVATLFPLGLLMGTAFPLGMRRAASRASTLMPWLWGINGATSVCASVLAVVIALSAGISAAFWTGVGSYAVAVLAFLWAGAGRAGATHAPRAAAEGVTR